MKTKQLIKILEKYDPNSPVMIVIPVRKDKYQTEFVAELEVVVDFERNYSSDCPQLCTKYWYKPVTDDNK